MPIKFLEPPPDALDNLRLSMKNMPFEFMGQEQIIRGIVEHPGQHMPHPIFSVNLSDLASEHGLNKAQHVAWRYLSDEEGDRDYAIEVPQAPRWEDGDYADLEKGPFIQQISRILEDDVIARQVAQEEMDLSMLRISALGVSAIWLRAREAHKDLIIPLLPAPHFLTAGQAYSVEEFHSALRPRASRRLRGSRTSDA